ncbi:MAG: sugar transferase [Pseudonocardiaceae bacterium]
MIDMTSVCAVPRMCVPPVVEVPVMGWEQIYRGLVVLVDVVVVMAVVWLGLLVVDGGSAGHLFVAVGVGCCVVGGLLVCRVWESRVLGQGVEELRRLVKAVVGAGVVLSLMALVVKGDYFRPWVFGVLPVMGLSLVMSRFGLRGLLHARRARGECMHAVLVAGSVEEVGDLIDRTRREGHYGWVVAGVCVPGVMGQRPLSVRGVPVVGGLGEVADVVRVGGYRVVAVAPDPYWSRDRIRRLAWDMEGVAVELVVAPALMEVTGPRLHVSPVYGLTLLHVSQPRFSGGWWVCKAVLDRVVAVGVLLMIFPLLVLVAVAIRLEDGGAVLFRQQRVGKAGELFEMVKFRSMVVDAERRRMELDAVNEGAGPLFKMRADPRITRVGGFLRRYSLDELPQLVNVLTGDMSLVGPRPPLPAEVAHYGVDARRRLLVKPGLTGLWQVSGRSDLSWEDTVRLDLRYVENCSPAMDAAIIWKTAGAVLRGRGAY